MMPGIAPLAYYVAGLLCTYRAAMRGRFECEQGGDAVTIADRKRGGGYGRAASPSSSAERPQYTQVALRATRCSGGAYAVLVSRCKSWPAGTDGAVQQFEGVGSASRGINWANATQIATL